MNHLDLRHVLLSANLFSLYQLSTQTLFYSLSCLATSSSTPVPSPPSRPLQHSLLPLRHSFVNQIMCHPPLKVLFTSCSFFLPLYYSRSLHHFSPLLLCCCFKYLYDLCCYKRSSLLASTNISAILTAQSHQDYCTLRSHKCILLSLYHLLGCSTSPAIMS